MGQKFIALIVTSIQEGQREGYKITGNLMLLEKMHHLGTDADLTDSGGL